MKPIRNHFYCLSCRRSKLLFESKAKADMFIYYNRKEILEEAGYAPFRSYYCSLCCGWHVTSNVTVEVGERLDKRDNLISEALKKKIAQNETKKYLNQTKAHEFDKHINKAKTLLVKGQKDNAAIILKSTICDINQELLKIPTWSAGISLKRRIKILLEFIDRYRKIVSDEEEFNSIVRSNPSDKNEIFFKEMVINCKAVSDVEDSFTKLKKMVETNSGEDALKMSETVKQTIQELKGRKQGGIKESYNQQLSVIIKNLRKEEQRRVELEHQFKKESLIAAFNKRKMAEDAYLNGEYQLCRTFLNAAYDILSKIEDCKRNRMIRTDLDSLAEKLENV